MKVKVFSSKDIHLLYLSPYVEFIIEQNRIIFRNDLFGKTTITPPTAENPEKVIERLKNGIDPQSAITFFQQNFKTNNPQLLIDGLIQTGIIE